MPKRIVIESNQLLAVEGRDEFNFFKAMLKHERIPDIQLLDIGGKDKFKVELPLLINSEGFSEVKTLGFVRDAEEHLASAAFSSICSSLKKYNLPIPLKINSIHFENNFKTGIFIMPNNEDAGMLEDLCIDSIKNEPVFPCITQYIDCYTSTRLEPQKKSTFPKPLFKATWLVKHLSATPSALPHKKASGISMQIVFPTSKVFSKVCSVRRISANRQFYMAFQ